MARGVKASKETHARIDFVIEELKWITNNGLNLDGGIKACHAKRCELLIQWAGAALNQATIWRHHRVTQSPRARNANSRDKEKEGRR